jgi:hypothetical protein
VFLRALLLAAVVSTAGASSADQATVKGWEMVARHLPREAIAVFKRSPAPEDRERALAEAVTQMDLQPVTDERLRAVIGQLTTLSRGSDEVALAAAYLIGRIYQVHFFQPDYGRAAQAYERLAREPASSYWGELARVKLALLKLYLLPDPAGPAARVTAAEALLAEVKTPELRRDLLIVIGRARLFHGLPGVIPPLVEAATIGGLVGTARADLQLQIAELSRREGDFKQARAFFEEFLAENEVDSRVYAVRVKLDEMASSTPGKAPAP